MTQTNKLFKGQKKRKVIPPNRHGKAVHTRKGRRAVKPLKSTSELENDRDLTKFINQCNEVKAATAANKEGGQLRLVKDRAPKNQPKKKKESAAKEGESKKEEHADESDSEDSSLIKKDESDSDDSDDSD